MRSWFLGWGGIPCRYFRAVDRIWCCSSVLCRETAPLDTVGSGGGRACRGALVCHARFQTDMKHVHQEPSRQFCSQYSEFSSMGRNC